MVAVGWMEGTVIKNILLTGPPRCGKSTVIEKLVRQIKRPVAGLFTPEIREEGERAFIANVKGWKDIILVTVLERNRDSLPASKDRGRRAEGMGSEAA